MEKLHDIYFWIPGSENVSPTKEVEDKKNSEKVLRSLVYRNSSDFIFIKYFKFKPDMDENSKMICLKNNIEDKVILIKNEFPYDCPKGTSHYVLWYSINKPENDQKINNDIYTCLKDKLGHNCFEFVWYENPKMSIPEIFHVQVFWRIII